MNKLFTLKSHDLSGVAPMAQVHDGCGGGNLSPELHWENAPEGTLSFALDIHDKDAPTPGGFWHWLIYNIPASCSQLPTGAGSADGSLLPDGVVQCVNDNGVVGYSGCYPPPGHGWHEYKATLYALDVETLDVPPSLPCGGVGFNIWCHTLAKCSLVFYYRNL